MYPGQITHVQTLFDIAGLYVWHCHIVEHEDNEMMVPYCVNDPGVDQTVPGTAPVLWAPGSFWCRILIG